ncbi:hypothetical protein CC1G_00762 [Coprinopsis cinerea okayama7|uniref:Uncharacterized protein n=1 Tax=Coprinopsis cinerea (strain Okayama-7 / 130 / ATCC MYA-4618 / FGSC 9003) TaxID=240176 RepID=A8N9E8_COPC7|nr:hypothetical protein CC1G_00762 [Coprinopsis cinerea okayama7\|eukprot:XP_001831215.1 hypothetical protein CC1G_00762 [Coprinopsis cinerea okayama7\
MLALALTALLCKDAYTEVRRRQKYKKILKKIRNGEATAEDYAELRRLTERIPTFGSSGRRMDPYRSHGAVVHPPEPESLGVSSLDSAAARRRASEGGSWMRRPWRVSRGFSLPSLSGGTRGGGGGLLGSSGRSDTLPPRRTYNQLIAHRHNLSELGYADRSVNVAKKVVPADVRASVSQPVHGVSGVDMGTRGLEQLAGGGRTTPPPPYAPSLDPEDSGLGIVLEREEEETGVERAPSLRHAYTAG